MRYTLLKGLIVSLSTAAIIDCATASYAINLTAPKAFLSNEIQGISGRNGLIGTKIYQGRKPIDLYYINRNKSTLEDTLVIEANKLLKVAYIESTGPDSSCSGSIQATLEANKHYAFIGALLMKKG